MSRRFKRQWESFGALMMSCLRSIGARAPDVLLPEASMYRFISPCVLRVLIAGAIVGAPAAAASQGRNDDPTSIKGIIHLLGCEARAEHFRLRALPRGRRSRSRTLTRARLAPHSPRTKDGTR